MPQRLVFNSPSIHDPPLASFGVEVRWNLSWRWLADLATSGTWLQFSSGRTCFGVLPRSRVEMAMAVNALSAGFPVHLDVNPGGLRGTGQRLFSLFHLAIDSRSIDPPFSFAPPTYVEGSVCGRGGRPRRLLWLGVLGRFLGRSGRTNCAPIVRTGWVRWTLGTWSWLRVRRGGRRFHRFG